MLVNQYLQGLLLVILTISIVLFCGCTSTPGGGTVQDQKPLCIPKTSEDVKLVDSAKEYFNVYIANYEKVKGKLSNKEFAIVAQEFAQEIPIHQKYQTIISNYKVSEQFKPIQKEIIASIEDRITGMEYLIKSQEKGIDSVSSLAYRQKSADSSNDASMHILAIPCKF